MIASPRIQAALHQAAASHKHLCPRQVLGVRIGLLAAQLLHLDVPQSDKRLYAFVETDGCFADGIAAATGCALGHRTLRLMDYGKVAATFIDTRTGDAFRIWPSPQCRDRAAQYAPAAPNRWRAQLDGYQVMPAAELLCVSAVELTIDLAALIGKPGVRATCSACGEEILNQREILRDEALLCRACADGSYVRIQRSLFPGSDPT